MGTSKVWRCLIPGTGGDCNGPDEVGWSYTGGDEYRCGADWFFWLEAGLDAWEASAGALAAGTAVAADPFSRARTSPLLTGCKYTSTLGLDWGFSMPDVARATPSLGLRPGRSPPVPLVPRFGTVRSTSGAE